MPMLNRIAEAAVKPLPRMISPNAHAILDYAIAGSLLASAAWLWRRNRRASLGALICGGAKLGLSLLTEYPGESNKAISFETHRDLDRGLAVMTASMPEILGFKDEAERKLFLAQGVIATVVGELTQFSETYRRAERNNQRRSAG